MSDVSPNSDQIALLERNIERLGGWVQFGDAKAGGVIVLLGLGVVDLLGHAHRLVIAHKLRSAWGDVATTGFWIAVVLAVAVVWHVSRALFPTVRAATRSLFFFGSVATYSSGSAYGEDFGRLTTRQTFDQLAEQAWELARIADKKFARTRLAYWFVLGFLAAWATARAALALA